MFPNYNNPTSTYYPISWVVNDNTLSNNITQCYLLTNHTHTALHQQIKDLHIKSRNQPAHNQTSSLTVALCGKQRRPPALGNVLLSWPWDDGASCCLCSLKRPVFCQPSQPRLSDYFPN